MNAEYKGYNINFSENSEEWGCYDISFSHASLAKVKQKIDRLHLDLRKASSIHALSARNYYNHELPRFFDATILEYVGPLREKASSFERVHTGPICDHVVYASFTDREGTKPSRKKVNLSEMYQDTPENHELMDELVGLAKQIKQMTKTMYEKSKKLASIDPALLAPLIEASGYVFSEGDIPAKKGHI